MTRTPTHPFTTQLRSTGVVVIGKSTMPEFGWSASTEFENSPPTRNPWNPDYSSGASSGGSAALVASGAVPIAHANDGGGSIRIPAAACGLVGLKPTRGRVAEAAEAATMPINIISNGVVSRTVRDTAHFLAGAEAHQAARRHAARSASSKVPAIAASASAWCSTPSPTRRPTTRLVPPSRTPRRCSRSSATPCSRCRSPSPRSSPADFTHYWSLLAFSTHHFGSRVIAPGFDKSRSDPLTRYLAGRFVRQAWRTPLALRGLKRSEVVYRTAFADLGVDLVLSPTLGHTTPRIGHLSPTVEFPEMFDRLVRYAAFTPLNNAAGAPAVSLPLGSTSDGLPIGVHFSALHGDERTLLEIAYELEDARPFARIQD